MAIRVEIALGKLVELGQHGWLIVNTNHPLGDDARWAMRRVEVRGVENGRLACFFGDSVRELVDAKLVYLQKEDARAEIIRRYQEARKKAHHKVQTLDTVLAELEGPSMKELPNA